MRLEAFHRKGFVKTIEVLIAIIMSFVFLVLIMPADTQVVSKAALGVLLPYENNLHFRNCVLEGNDGCINGYLDSDIPPHLDYKILITEDPNENLDLPEKKVYAETLYFAGNITNSSTKILKLFYWEMG